MDATVLVVDDDPATCRLIAQMLTPRGYTVSIACDGLSGLAAVERERPALVILDVHLPGLDGLTALMRLRQDDPRLPIIVVSAAADALTRLAAVPDVPDRESIRFLAKPFPLVTLLALVQHLLPSMPQSAASLEAEGLRR
jgi:CheY-like chemotaxis protein